MSASDVNIEEASKFLSEFIELCVEANDTQGTTGWGDLDRQLEGLLAPAAQVVEAIDPDLHVGMRKGSKRPRWGDPARHARRALGLLENHERLAHALRPSGPSIDAAALHRWVWESAQTLWFNKHYRQAVAGAAERIDLETRTKLDRWDLTGGKLANQAWSTAEPQEGHPRLRPAGFQEESESYTSALVGARAFHEGCMKRIRNLATHESDELSPQIALEQLAALSLLARWIEEAQVEGVDH